MANPNRGRFRITHDKVVAAAVVGAAFVMTVVLQPGLTAKLLDGLGF
ncbi:hypothetical protein SAMN05216241_11032 [Limimonas halophila]|uniref:Uncharacterized protein n=1 Tax=Limimonas halophila TaxID=1082479 RepID=A0A1G7TQ87_9PROT|nr:hypothetical protein [Limimonas halophila]SDG37497.1 hypothetical protein SAMN05216241_11032 [Limimonas halophila]